MLYILPYTLLLCVTIIPMLEHVLAWHLALMNNHIQSITLALE